MSIPASHIDLLERAIIWHVATIGTRGEPQSSPVWAGVDDEGHPVISMLKRRQKVKNLVANPSIAMSAYEVVGDSYRHLELRGTVTIEDDPDHSLIHAMAKKYLGLDEYPLAQPDEERVTVRVEVRHSAAMG